MTADTFITPNERAFSGAAALVMHGLFFALLVFGVTWQKREPVAMVAELWNNLPPMSAPKPEPEVKPQPEPPPPPPPKAEAKPAPKAEPVPVPKADIALKDKKDRERKAQEQALAEKKKREQEQARLTEQKEQQSKAEAQRLAREQDEALKKIAAQQASVRAAEIEKYKRAIAARIKQYYVEVPVQGNPEVEMEVIVLPGGEVLGVKTKRASGQPAWDNMVERAIIRAGGGTGLPVPKDPELFREFRELNLKFRPKE